MESDKFELPSETQASGSRLSGMEEKPVPGPVIELNHSEDSARCRLFLRSLVLH